MLGRILPTIAASRISIIGRYCGRFGRLDGRMRPNISGARTRARGVSGADTPFRILLIHFANGHSLTETAVGARSAGLGRMTAVAIFKRLHASEKWRRRLAKEL